MKRPTPIRIVDRTALGIEEGQLLHPLSVKVIPVMPALTVEPSEVHELVGRLRSVLAKVAG